MRKRYDLRRSDNYGFTGRKSHRCKGNGLVEVITGFPVTSAIITWATLPVVDPAEEMQSSSSSSSSSSFDFISDHRPICITINSAVDGSFDYLVGQYFYAGRGYSSLYPTAPSYLHEDGTAIIGFDGGVTTAGVWDGLGSGSWYAGPASSNDLQTDYAGGLALLGSGLTTPTGSFVDFSTTSYFFDVQYCPVYSSSSSSSEGNSSSSSSTEGFSSSSSSGDSSSSSESSSSMGTNSSSSSSSVDSSSSSSSTTSGSSSSSSVDSSSSSSVDSSSSSSSDSSSSSVDSSSSSSSSDSSSSSSSSEAWQGSFLKPRIYVYDYSGHGFRVKYENVPEESGYIEFSYLAF